MAATVGQNLAQRRINCVEDDANSLPFAPNEVATFSGVIRDDCEIRYRWDINRILDLKGGAGVRDISNKTIHSRAAKRDRSDFQHMVTFVVSLVLHRVSSVRLPKFAI